MKLLVLGGDARMVYAAECFASAGHAVALYHPAIPSALPEIELSALSSADAALLPMPLTRDGESLCDSRCRGIPLPILQDYPDCRFAGGGGLPILSPDRYFNYAESAALITANARLTALGTLSHVGALMEEYDLLTVGYGAVGQALAVAAAACGYRVFVAARREEIRRAASERGFFPLPIGVCPDTGRPLLVCNTVPAPILDADFFKRLPKHSRYYELASLPGGISAGADTAGVAVTQLMGIPGKFAPKEAGRIIFEVTLPFFGA